ncbi:hypothetical protein [[Clostridium] fimetarium]|uniref:Uncharacterized protein n=1 Tax=[Clostridium] fimetarium TaxID=99656 RepID=A0A1I0NRW2_9FIRM|nr:hypothetical protein [[Clostridium] fimetarium]SEW04300.1 hypothetical protein SAMN05421659_103329 [[Clostridium] fimetarium]
MNYYLVFQNKSYKEESNGGYIWAPQKNKKGDGEFHWHNVAGVKKGDVILHCVKQSIVAISEAIKNGHEEKRPEELKERGEWDNEAWHAPFNKNGKGNQGYLYEINKELYEYMFVEMLKEKQAERMKLYLEKVIKRI